MKPQEVSNTLWSLEALRVPLTGELRDSLLRAAQRTSKAMNEQGVANTLWALGELVSSSGVAVDSNVERALVPCSVPLQT